MKMILKGTKGSSLKGTINNKLLETESIKAIGRQIAKTHEQHFFIVYLGKQPTSTQQDTVFMRLFCTVQYVL